MTALVIVDVQNDFLPATSHRGEGALSVTSGNEILPVIQGLLHRDQWDWDAVIATQDYHPPGHISFASRYPSNKIHDEVELTDGHGKTYVQHLWPDHCVQGSPGVEIESQLESSLEVWRDRLMIARKACYEDVEAYSAVEGYLTPSTNPQDPPMDLGPRHVTEGDFTKHLHQKGVNKVVITGLATDFCVHQTTLDALTAGFDTVLLAPTTKAVFPDRAETIYDELEGKGVRVLGRAGKDWKGDLRKWMA